MATIRDIAVAEKVSERFVSRTMRLAYLSPIVLERLVAHRRPCSLSIKDLIAAAERPWCEQEALVFETDRPITIALEPFAIQLGPRRYRADAIAAWIPRMFAPLLSTFWNGSARPEIQILSSESMSKVPAFSIE